LAVTVVLQTLPHPPTPRKQSQAAGRVGGRDKFLGRRTCRQGA